MINPIRGWRAVPMATACALVLLVGCAQYDPGGPATPSASSTPSGTTPDASAPAQSPTTSTPPRISFNTRLPTGPDTVGGPGAAEDTVYRALHNNQCGTAQSQLDGRDGSELSWDNMQSPSYVVLFQAAIAACRGDLSEAQRWYRRGEQLVGYAGTVSELTPTPCYLYQALRSVFDQVPWTSVRCPGGSPAQWAQGPDGTVKADPRRDPYPPPSDSPSPEPSPSDTSSASASAG
jgi:hypothetical protein